MIDYLIQLGPIGMFLAAFLAGSFFPFSSEIVMLTLMAMGVDYNVLIISGTAGNVLGGIFNYYIGRLGRTEWIQKYLHVKPSQMEKARKFMRGRGAWMGFFAFIPIIGSAITILLGIMRANIFITFTSITLGKFLRYLVLVYGVIIITWISNLVGKFEL